MSTTEINGKAVDVNVDVKADRITAEVPAASPRPEATPEPVKPVVAKPEVPEVPEPAGSLVDQASHEAERGAGLPGVDIRGSYPHRPRV